MVARNRGRCSRPLEGRLSPVSRQVVARNRGRCSLYTFSPKTTASPCLLNRRLFIIKRLVDSLQRDSLCQWNGRRGSNPRQPAWKAGGHAIAVRSLYIGLTAGFIRCTSNVSGPGKRCRARFLRLAAKHVANISMQEVTLLNILYPTFSPLTIWRRK